MEFDILMRAGGEVRVGGGEKVALIIFLIPPDQMEWVVRCE